MLEPHYIALPAFTVGIFLGVLLGGCPDRIREGKMTAIYILGLATAGLIAGLNIRDEVRARGSRNKRNHRQTRRF